MKKEYIAPKIDIVRLQCDGNILIGSLNGGEVGAPQIDTFDDAEAFEAAGLGDSFGIPGFE